MIYDANSKTITTQRLQLRLFQQSDVQKVAHFCQSDSIYRNALYIPRPYTLESAKEWMPRHEENYDNDRAYEFAVTDRITGELLGAIALSHNQNFQHGELAYWIGEEYWNQGYATEASQAMLEFAFIIKNYHKVFARYFASNPASGKVMVKLGMMQEGVLKEHVKKDGRFEDLICYGIVRSTWTKQLLKIESVDSQNAHQLYKYWQSIGKSVPYFFPVDFKSWYDCLQSDTRDGELIFIKTYEYIASLKDKVVGFIQFGIPVFHYNTNGEKIKNTSIGVIRNLYFDKNFNEVGHQLMIEAEKFFTLN